MIGMIVSILLAGILTENTILSRFLGVDLFLNNSKKVVSVCKLSVVITVVLLITTGVIYPIYKFVLLPLHIEFLNTLLMVVITIFVVELLKLTIKKIKPLQSFFGEFIEFVTANSVVLGVVLINFAKGYNFPLSILNVLASGIGFMLAMVIFAGVRSRIEKSEIPEFLKGLPITLFAAAIVSLAFLGFRV